jgi:hypothetical protein
MLSTVPALTLLSMDPSPAVAASVQQAAGTRHGLVNVTRLVRSLNKQRLAHAREEMEGSSWIAVQKDWEVSYNTLQEGADARWYCMPVRCWKLCGARTRGAS